MKERERDLFMNGRKWINMCWCVCVSMYMRGGGRERERGEAETRTINAPMTLSFRLALVFFLC